MPINRPDDPSGPKGAERRQRSGDHPDRAADLQERADGAHAEQLVDPRDAPPAPTQPSPSADEPAARPGSEGAEGRAESGPQPRGTGRPGPADGVTSPAPTAERGSGRAVTISLVAILLVVGLIYLAMIAGVFAVD
jgi:hypothetical protein